MRKPLMLCIVILCVTTANAQTRRAPAQPSAAERRAQLMRAEMVVVINDTGFSQKLLNVVPGRETHVVVNNLGKLPHGLRIKIGKQEFGPTQSIAPGEHVEFTFTPPKENGGMGEFYSPVPDDKNNGAFRGRVVPGSPWGEGG